MKNKWIILLLLIFCRCTNEISIIEENEDNFSISRGDCFPIVSDRYIYPIVPGMIEWQQLESIDDTYKHCQLPDSVLKNISTPGLIDALIHAPMFTDFYTLSNSASALKWQAHYQNFNSATDLFMRKDAGNALVAYYKLVNFDCFINTSVGTYREYERMMGLEILFTKQEILDNMEHEKKKEGIAALLANYEQYGYWHSLFPMAHIMLADKYAPIVQYSQEHIEEFQYTLEGYDYPSNPNQWNIIISYVKNFINDKK